MTDKLKITPKTEFAEFDAFVSQKGKDKGIQGAMGKGGLEIYTSKKAAAKLNAKAVGQNMRLCTVSSLGQELGKKGLHAALSNTYGQEVANYVFQVMRQDLFAPGARIDKAMMDKVHATIEGMFDPGVHHESDLHKSQSSILAQSARQAKKPSTEASRPQTVTVQAADDANAFTPPQTIGRQRAILFLTGKQAGFQGISALDHLLLDAGWEDETIDKRAARAAVIDAFEQDAVFNHGRTDTSDSRNREIALGALRQYLDAVRTQQPAAHAPETGPSGTDASQPRTAGAPDIDLRFGNDPTQVLAKQRALLLLESRSEKSEKRTGLEDLLIEAGWEGNSIDVRKAILAVMKAFAADDVLCDSQAENYDAHMKEVAVEALKTFLATAPNQPAPEVVPPPKAEHEDARAKEVDEPVVPDSAENDEHVDDVDDEDNLDQEVEALFGPGDQDDVESTASENGAAIQNVHARMTDVRNKVDAVYKTYDDINALVTNNQRNIANRRKALARRRRAGSIDTPAAEKARLAREAAGARNAKRTNGFQFAEVADNGGNKRGVPSLGAMLKAAGKKPGQRVDYDAAKKAIIEGFANYNELDYTTLTRAQHAEKIAIPALRAFLQNASQ